VLSSSRIVSSSSWKASGSTSSSFESGRGVRMPATTSSPCALNRKSPKGSPFSPVTLLRVKATPVADCGPVFPNTICCTLTAVPRSCGMWLSRR
jgi:hypothetical protein